MRCDLRMRVRVHASFPDPCYALTHHNVNVVVFVSSLLRRSRRSGGRWALLSGDTVLYSFYGRFGSSGVAGRLSPIFFLIGHYPSLVVVSIGFIDRCASVDATSDGGTT